MLQSCAPNTSELSCSSSSHRSAHPRQMAGICSGYTKRSVQIMSASDLAIDCCFDIVLNASLRARV